MNETTAKSRVLAAFPSARVERKGFCYFIKSRSHDEFGPWDRILGHGRKELAAWEDATRHGNTPSTTQVCQEHQP